MTVIYGNESQYIQSRLVGEFWTTSILAAIACGVACGLDLRTCATAVARVEAQFGRYSVHQVPGGPTFVFDLKAPVWTLPHCLAFFAGSRAPRKTIVLGNLSSHPGKSGRLYRRVAQDALNVADRVVFVGPNAAHVDRLRQGEIGERLLPFATVHEASTYVHAHTLPDELIVVKGSLAADHLERIVLGRFEPVVCWKERCGKVLFCPECPDYRRPHPPHAKPKSSIEDAESVAATPASAWPHS